MHSEKSDKWVGVRARISKSLQMQQHLNSAKLYSIIADGQTEIDRWMEREDEMGNQNGLAIICY